MLYLVSKTWIYAIFICQPALWISDIDLEIITKRAVLQTKYATTLSTQTVKKQPPKTLSLFHVKKEMHLIPHLLCIKWGHLSSPSPEGLRSLGEALELFPSM